MEKQIIFKIIKSHQTEYLDPIKVVAGDHLKLGDYASESKWKDWIWAENSQNQAGWVPVQLVDFSKDKLSGFILEDFDAHELNIEVGELVTRLKSINGWSLVIKLNDNSKGWIPNENMEVN